MTTKTYEVQWNKTQRTWHTDVDGIGRYSLQKPKGESVWRAYLNNVPLAGVPAGPNVEGLKEMIAERIVAAKIIAGREGDLPVYDRRKELISAAKGGIGILLNSTRGSAMFGTSHKILDTAKGFVVVYGEDNRVYFDLMEM